MQIFIYENKRQKSKQAPLENRTKYNDYYCPDTYNGYCPDESILSLQLFINLTCITPIVHKFNTVTFEGAEFAQLLVRFGQVTPNL